MEPKDKVRIVIHLLLFDMQGSYIARYIVWSDVVASRKCELSSYMMPGSCSGVPIAMTEREKTLRQQVIYVCQNTPIQAP